MIRELGFDEWNRVSELFSTHILAKSLIFPCMKVGLGSVTVDNTESPTVVMYSTPLMVFVAGNADTPEAQEMVKSLQPYILLITNDKGWKDLLKREWGNQLETDIRAHLDHSTLDLDNLRNQKSRLESGYTLKRLDLDAALQIKENYMIPIKLYLRGVENLVEHGIGFCIMKDDKLISVAYTPFPFTDEFEIQVFTDESIEYRRKGLGTIVAAALIEYALENGLIPHWDAANEVSVKLAMKLGYSNPIQWEAFYFKPE